MSVEEQIDEQPLDGLCVGGDLVVAGGFGLAQFQPVQRAFAGQRGTDGAPGGQLVDQAACSNFSFATGSVSTKVCIGVLP